MKRIEIGSEFWLYDIPNEYIGGSPYWINSLGSNALTSSGRGAISLMLKQVEDKIISKTVLLPAYICECVIIPFIRNGYTCYFYDVDNNLEPNKESINAFMEKEVGIFLHMGYFGFNSNDNLCDCISKFKENGTIIVEDLTHTLFSEYKRHTENDYYVVSLRKWIGLPSGGVLASKSNNIQQHLCVQTDYSNKREEALLLKGEYIKSNKPELKQIYLSMFKEAESVIDNDSGYYAIDEMSNSIIKELDINELIKKRKSNYTFLLKALKGIKEIEPVFNEIPYNICPLFFPVYIYKEREKLRKSLINEGIYCPVHWPIPSQVGILNYPSSKKIYSNILSIPCDQRYDMNDMNRIVDCIKRDRRKI